MAGPRLRYFAYPALAAMLVGCATREVAPPQPLPTLPTIYLDSQRTTATATEAPIGTNFKTTNQYKLQASQHWMNIADDAGRSLVGLLRKAGKCASQFDPCRSVYVNPPEVVTEFSRAFYNQVITTLVKAGIPVSKNAKAELTLDIDVQPISFSPNRPQYRHAGVASELGPGVWALRDVVAVNPADPQAVPPTADALHWFRAEFASGKTPQTEILVTASVGSAERYLARATNAYYIADADRHLYDQEICSLYKLCPSAASGSGDAAKKKEQPAAPARMLSVVGDCPVDKCVYPAANGTAAPATSAKPATKKKVTKKK